MCIAINLSRNDPYFCSLALWNPTTKEYNILPKPPRPYITTYELLGFGGYYKNEEDYKVLRVIEDRDKSFHQADVYKVELVVAIIKWA